MAKRLTPKGCPLKQIVDALDGRLRRDFDCGRCWVNKSFCSAYVTGGSKRVGLSTEMA